MRIDGRALAQTIIDRLKRRVEEEHLSLTLDVFSVKPDFATRQFTRIKQKTGEKIGITVNLIELPEDTTTETLVEALAHSAHEHDGIIVQLPLPEHIDRDVVMQALPATHDVDGIGHEATALRNAGSEQAIMPPVTAAIRAILDAENVAVQGKRVVVVGRGRLVGQPTAVWLEHEGADVTSVSRSTTQEELARLTTQADIIVLGAGVPGLLTPDMVSAQAVVLDAGTSESEGETAGDADPRIGEKVALLTPVPGGIGPVAVAIIFDNLLELALRG